MNRSYDVSAITDSGPVGGAVGLLVGIVGLELDHSFLVKEGTINVRMKLKSSMTVRTDGTRGDVEFGGISLCFLNDRRDGRSGQRISGG